MPTFTSSRAWFGDRRDESAYLQVTAHPERRVVTFSHWQGRICHASSAVDLDEVPELVAVLTAALAQAARTADGQGDDRPLRAIAAERIRARWQAAHAEVVDRLGSVAWPGSGGRRRGRRAA